MTVQEIREIQQSLLLDFRKRVSDSLKRGEIYDFSMFLAEPIIEFKGILGNNMAVKYTLHGSKKGVVEYHTKSDWTLIDWAAVLMLNILKLVYKINIPSKLLESALGFELLSFMFFSLWDNMIINRVVTTKTNSTLKCSNVKMLTVSEVAANRGKFEEALSSYSIFMRDLSPHSRNKGLVKIDLTTLKLPVIVTPGTSQEDMDVEVLTEFSNTSSGVEAEVNMYSPQAYLDALVQCLHAFMQQVSAVCKFTHVKSDLSIRIMYSSMNVGVLTKFWESEQRLNTAIGNSASMTEKGYLQIPDLELPENDTSQTRALNLLRILDFKVKTKGLTKIKNRSNIAYKDARLALQLLIMNMCPDQKLKSTIYTALRNADIISDGIDIYSFDTPEVQYQRVMELFNDKHNNTAAFDSRAYDALKHLCDNPEKVLLELQPIDFSKSEFTDVTNEFASVANQLEWLVSIARDNVVRLNYMNSGGFTEAKTVTKSTKIVSLIYGIGWKTIGRNYSLREKKNDLEASIAFVRTSYNASMLVEIAKQWGITCVDIKELSQIEGKTKEELIKLGYSVNLQSQDEAGAYTIENGSMSLVGVLQPDKTFSLGGDREFDSGVDIFRRYLLTKLQELLDDVGTRFEKGRKASKANEGKFTAYSLEVNKALMKIDPKNFNLFRSFSLANIEKVEVLKFKQ